MDISRGRTMRMGTGPRRPWVNWILAIVCLGVGLAALLAVVMPFHLSRVAQGGAGSRPGWPWLLVGLALAGAGLHFVWRAYRWQPPLVDQVRAEKGLPVQVELGESGAAGGVQVRLKHLGEIQEALAAWEVELGGETSLLQQTAGRSREALVYFDPQSGLPTALQVETRLYPILPGKVRIIQARDS